MLEIKNLTKTYQGVKAIDQVSFTVKKGHVVGFLGSNGAGKTTTMDIICGCIGSDQGHVSVCGFDILDEPIKAKAKIGYVPDVPPLYREMTVCESVTYAAKLNHVPKTNVSSRVQDVVNQLSLEDVLHKLVGSLSKGYRQRVALAHALVHDPEVLVLDEPTEGLDPRQIAQMRETILSLKATKAIILSSHILHEVENLCDQLVIIDKGKIVTTGSFDEIAARFESHSYTLSVRSVTDQILSELSRLDYVSHVNQDEKNHSTFTFELSKPEQLDDIAGLVIKKGWGLKKVASSASSLEGIFEKATATEPVSSVSSST